MSDYVLIDKGCLQVVLNALKRSGKQRAYDALKSSCKEFDISKVKSDAVQHILDHCYELLEVHISIDSIECYKKELERGEL